MSKVKVIEVVAEPTARGPKAELGFVLEGAVNGFLDANPKVDVKGVSVSVDNTGSFKKAVAVVLYDGELGSKKASKPETK